MKLKLRCLLPGCTCRNIARDPVQGGIEGKAVKSSYRLYVRVTKLMRHSSEDLQLVEKLNDKTTGEDSIATRDALRATHLDKEVLSSADGH